MKCRAVTGVFSALSQHGATSPMPNSARGLSNQALGCVPPKRPYRLWNSLDFCVQKWSHNCRNVLTHHPASLTHEDGHWALHSPFHTLSPAGSEHSDQSDHSLVRTWQPCQADFLTFTLGNGRGSISLECVPECPFSCHPMSDLGQTHRVPSHVE